MRRHTCVRINVNMKIVENVYVMNIPTYRKEPKISQFGIWNILGEIRI